MNSWIEQLLPLFADLKSMLSIYSDSLSFGNEPVYIKPPLIKAHKRSEHTAKCVPKPAGGGKGQGLTFFFFCRLGFSLRSCGIFFLYWPAALYSSAPVKASRGHSRLNESERGGRRLQE